MIILEKCAVCHVMIHPNFAGHHKCGHVNCPVCKEAITNSEYWGHVRSHPGHENDAPPPKRTYPQNAGSFRPRNR
jgi:hypothetical protein